MKYIKKMVHLLLLVIAVGGQVFAGTFIAQVVMMIFTAATGVSIPEYIIYDLSGQCGFGAAGMGIYIFIRKSSKIEFVEKKERFSFSRMLLFGVLSICICRIIFDTVSSAVFGKLFPTAAVTALQAEKSDLISGMSTEWTGVMLFSASVVAPLMEEFLMRKCIHSVLRWDFGVPIAILMNTILFAVIHGYGVQGFFSCALAGFLLTFLYEKTGCIWYSIVVHIFCNLVELGSGILNGIKWFGTPLCYEINHYKTYHIGIFIAAIIVSILVIEYLKINQNHGRENNVSDTDC